MLIEQINDDDDDDIYYFVHMNYADSCQLDS